MDERELREASQSQWSSAAGGWARKAAERESGPPGAAADRMLEVAALRPGERVLELACGAADVGLRAAEAVGPGGRVVCSDFAEPMVDVVRERAESLGLAQVEARILDAEDLQLGDERFDCVLCRFGYMLMADPGRALRGTHGALDKGGRVVLAVWGSQERNPWLSLVTDSVMRVLDAPPPGPETPGPFALANHERLGDLLSTAGFGDVSIEDVEAERVEDSLDDWWAGVLEVSSPIGVLLSQLGDDQRASIRDEAVRGGQRYAEADGTVRFPASVVVASAVRTTA